jgi:gamma-glutamyl-gamma-aminobutyrate hydrolase PuuD
MIQPLIGLTTSLPPKGAAGAQINASYLHAVQLAGGVPVLIPPQLEVPALVSLLQTIDALILTGGGDVDPSLYGEQPHPAVAGVSPERDQVELASIRFALGQRLPLLAICRGMQVLNVALGGSLIQHIPEAVGADIAHAVSEPRDGPAHSVRIAPGSRLAGLVGVDVTGVNSRHHQAVKDVGQGLVPVAWAPDDVIEGLEMPGRWVVGVQWHPEDLVDASPAARGLFEGVVAAAESALAARAPTRRPSRR